MDESVDSVYLKSGNLTKIVCSFGFPFINGPMQLYVMQKEGLWNGTLKWLKL